MPRSRQLSISLATLTLLASATLASGSSETSASGSSEAMRVEALTVEHGLAQSSVFVSFKSSDGFMWFGTQAGLDRYDGYSMTHYQVPEGEDSIVFSIAEDDHGELWIATRGHGVSRLDRPSDRLTTFRHDPLDPQSLSGDRVRILHRDRRGKLWIGTIDGGLDRLADSGDRFIRYPIDPTADCGGGVWALADGDPGALWVGTARGLCRLDPEQRTFQGVPLEFGSEVMVRALARDPLGTLWVGTDRGLGRLRDGLVASVANLEIPPTLRGDGITRLAVGPQGLLWIASSERGLFLLDPATGLMRAARDEQNHLAEAKVASLYTDRQGLLWIGTMVGGVFKYDSAQRTFRVLHHEVDANERTGANTVFDISTDHEGDLWIATHAGIFRHHGSEPPERFRIPGSGSRLLVDRRGQMWAGGSSGLYRFEVEKRSFERDPRDPWTDSDASIVALHEDHQGDLWVATVSHGLLRLPTEGSNAEVWTAGAAEERGLSSAYLVGLWESPQGHLWVATDDAGLTEIAPDRQSVRHHHRGHGISTSLQSDQIIALVRPPAQDLWLTTAGGHLARYDEQLERFVVHDDWYPGEGLPPLIVDLLIDRDGSLWLATLRGLYRYSPESGTTREFTLRDGLTGLEFNTVGHDPRTEELFFGGVRGLHRLWPEDVEERHLVAPVVLTGIRSIAGHLPSAGEISRLEEITLTGDERRYIAFEFASLDLRDPLRNRYAYRLEGQDEEWIEAGDQRSASYTNLPGGTFTFQVKAAGADGVWNDEGLRLKVRVIPPLWQRQGIRAAAVAAATLAIFGIIVGRLARRIRRAEQARREAREIRRRLFEARENERRRLARELHDGPLQDLHGLRLMLGSVTAESSHRDAANATASSPLPPTTLTPAIEGMRRITGTLRELCGELRPPILGARGLNGALSTLAGQIEQLSPGLTVELEVEPAIDALNDNVATGLFRIAQEALRNTARHADARTVTLRLEVDAEGVTLEIEDDGRGFRVPERWIELGRQGAFGLLGVAERVDALGGELEVTSAPGSGTRVRITLDTENTNC